MDFRALAQQLYIQFATTRYTLIPLALAALLTGLAVWRLMTWRYDAKLRKLRKTIEHRESEILLLRARGGAVGPVQAPVAAVSEDEQARAEANARRKALRVITNGIEGASMAQAGDPGAAERAMPNVWLALLAAQRTYGVALPTLNGDPVTNLATGRRLLELIRPCLMVGDDDEARRVAAEFLRRSGIAEADVKSRAAA